eukprot:CAMPEP_0172609044 /NCGR_PEP_ID=MMETSP1068-20121228/29065_1 /TAXON_ID=35684 /ORGANISM="Pseudopedinella elastica, Strain CCMP716" /LENGTH=183 /DNA_ID=CAMNT_0013412467 /DNA_START=179 /DNA_END=730 /DNA_ORIENTATION=-
MIDTFWCDKCGRLLCDKHRNQHTCERVDHLAAKRRAMTAEEIAAEVREKQNRQLQAAAEEAAEKEAKLRAASEGYTERKARRKIIAGKSTHIANFLQRAALQTQDQRAKAELLELYQKANRVNLELWNEFETPTVPGTKDDSWAEAVAAYRRGSEITGMVIMLEGRQLETRNPWDPPPAQGEL